MFLVPSLYNHWLYWGPPVQGAPFLLMILIKKIVEYLLGFWRPWRILFPNIIIWHLLIKSFDLQDIMYVTRHSWYSVCSFMYSMLFRIKIHNNTLTKYYLTCSLRSLVRMFRTNIEGRFWNNFYYTCILFNAMKIVEIKPIWWIQDGGC